MKKQPEFPQEVVLISHRFESLHRVELAEPGVLGQIHPPKCGSCHHFEAGLCRERLQKVAAKDVSCTAHQFQPGHAELVGLVGQLRRHPGRAHLVQALSSQFHEASDEDAKHLGEIEAGQRSPVTLRSSEAVPLVPTRINQQTGLGDVAAVQWVDPDVSVVAVNRLPAVEF